MFSSKLYPDILENITFALKDSVAENSWAIDLYLFSKLEKGLSSPWSV